MLAYAAAVAVLIQGVWTVWLRLSGVEGCRSGYWWPPEKLAGREPADLKLTRLIPLQMRRRGIEMKFVINGDSRRATKTDPALLKVIARAHCWFDDLVSGRAASMVEIGKREKVGKRYVSRIIRLAFLAPDIVEQIVNGCQPPELTAECLLRDRTQLPLEWESQHRMLGLSLSN